MKSVLVLAILSILAACSTVPLSNSSRELIFDEAIHHQKVML